MYLVWDPNPEFFSIGGFSVGWYGFLFALGFLLSQRLVIFMYKKEGKPERDLESLLVHLIVGTVVGARLAHCLFYDPLFYLSHPLEILKIWEGGLASHGATIGIISALYVFSRRKKDQGLLWLVDRVVIVSLMTAALVRTGNFINGEIVGTPTQSGYGVVFASDVHRAIIEMHPQVARCTITQSTSSKGEPPGVVPVDVRIEIPSLEMDEGSVRAILEREIKSTLARHYLVTPHIRQPQDVPLHYSLLDSRGVFIADITTAGIARHPVQLYEGVFCLLLAVVFFVQWWKRKGTLPHGTLLGWFFVLVFTARIFIDTVKEKLAPVETALPVGMGQLLSVPFVIVGVWLVWRVRRRAR
jgi:phosphatidylglycerol---prolipoprotein diacylglyceryl transferase